MIKVFVLFCILAISEAKRSPRIHYGRKVTVAEINGKYSFVASLYIETGNKATVCTGSFIAPNMVLTAAHCLCKVKQMRVFYKTIHAGYGDYVAVSDFQKHDQYPCGNTKIFSANIDLGLVRLVRNVPGVRTIPVDCNTQAAGQFISMIGYGIDERKKSGALKIGRRRTTRCAPSTQGAICVEGKTKGRDRTSPGDSGGPLVTGRHGSLVQIGVCSGAWGTKFGVQYTFAPVKNICHALKRF